MSSDIRYEIIPMLRADGLNSIRVIIRCRDATALPPVGPLLHVSVPCHPTTILSHYYHCVYI